MLAENTYVKVKGSTFINAGNHYRQKTELGIYGHFIRSKG